jgi:hypothetical protein
VRLGTVIIAATRKKTPESPRAEEYANWEDDEDHQVNDYHRYPIHLVAGNKQNRAVHLANLHCLTGKYRKISTS